MATQSSGSAARRKVRPTVSLVLGAGGARGLAHIGVIEVLEQAGYEIRSIAGTSMGALVGGIYATGKLGTYRDWVCALSRADVLRLVDVSFARGGLIKGERIIGVLKELIGDHLIERLPIAFTAVAVDLDSQREVWFSRGPLFEAIRASIAIPTVFTPFIYQGRTLVDGGVLDPLPVAPTLRDMTDLTVVVNVNGASLTRPLREDPAEAHLVMPAAPPGGLVEVGDASDAPVMALASYRKKIAEFIDSLQKRRMKKTEVVKEPGYFELMSRSLDTMQSTISRLRLASHVFDMEVSIPRNACDFYEFYRAQEMIQLGRERTREALADYQARHARRHGNPGALGHSHG